MDKQNTYASYCLRHDQEVTITAPADVMGALYTCPLCGKITEQRADLQHIIEPSDPLLERLKSTQKLHGAEVANA
jgi:hypothetical protein